MKKSLNVKNAPPAIGPYSHATLHNEFVYTSGQIYLTTEGKLLEDTFENQIHQVMRNLKAILEEAGTNFANVMKTTIYVTDMSTYKTINEIYGTYFTGNYPAREVVCVKELPLGAKVEISMVAIKG